ncbi:TGF-beta-activated kinase 1 and MAP3K7-binding protein 2, partial [Bienertia sinuspersici]
MSDERTTQESRKRIRDEDEDMDLTVIVIGFIMIVVDAWYGQKYRVNEVTWNEHERALKRATWMKTLKNNRICREQLRLDIHCFEKLCHILQSKGGLVTTRNVTVKEIVALFLHTLAHDLKNRAIQFFLLIGKYYIEQVDENTSFAEDNKWKWFEDVVGALDGTHIKMTGAVEDRPRYEDRKGDISTNVIPACDSNLRFTY